MKTIAYLTSVYARASDLFIRAEVLLLCVRQHKIVRGRIDFTIPPWNTFFKPLDEVRKMGEAECLRVAERHSINNETAKLASFSARPPQVR